MNYKYYIVKTDKPVAHYIVKLTTAEARSITMFMNSILNPEYTIGRRGTIYTISDTGYDSMEDAKTALGDMLF